MDTDTLRPGDILVFEAESGGFISKAIALLTRSAVSHSAMLIERDALVEMSIEGGIDSYAIRRVEDNGPTPNSRFVHQLRLDKDLDMAPVVTAALRYLAANTQYNMPLLVMLGGLLVLRGIPFSNAGWPFVGHILRGAVRALDEWIGQMRNAGKTMVCSQLCCQCHLDAGEEYAIRFKSAILEGAQGFRLADHLGDSRPEPVCEQAAELAEPFWRDFCQALESDAPGAFMPPQDVLPAARTFVNLAGRLARQTGTPIDAMFITPADLLRHAVNLKHIADMRIHWGAVRSDRNDAC